MLTARDTLNKESIPDRGFRREMYNLIGVVYDCVDLDQDGVLNKQEVEFADFVGNMVSSAIANPTEALPDTYDDTVFGGDKTMKTMQVIDLDGDGKISLNEFMHLAEGSIKGWGQAMSTKPNFAKGVEELFTKGDVSGDGALGLRELQYATFLLSEFLLTQTSLSLFEELDTDDNGRIQWSELETALETSRQRNANSRVVTVVDIIGSLFHGYDSNKDGALDQEETFKLVESMIRSMQKQVAAARARDAA